MNSQPEHSQFARERLPNEFAVLDVVISETNSLWANISECNTGLEWLSVRFADRAFNVLNGAKMLLEVSHWELAAPLVRQLFELTVNLEEIHNNADPEAAVEKYRRFALLQQGLHVNAANRYESNAGTNREQSRADLAIGEAAVEQFFPEFRHKNGNWAHSWSGKTTRALAEGSDRKLRLPQYDVLFKIYSAYAHGSPLVVAGSLEEQEGRFNQSARMKADDKGVDLVNGQMQSVSTFPLLTGSSLRRARHGLVVVD